LSANYALPTLEALEDRRLLTASFQFSSSVYQVANTQQAIAITVTLIGENPGSPTQSEGGTVDYSASPSTIAQPPARPGVDFVPTSGTLEFSPETPSQTFTVTILDGSQSGSFINPIYYVDLALSNPTGGIVLGTPSQALLKITTTPPSRLTLTTFPLKAAQNQTLTTEIAEVQDAVPNLLASSYNAVISWGDGTPAQTVPLQPQGTFFTVNGSHLYTREGTFTYTLTVTPANGPAATTTGTVLVGGFVTGLYNDLFDRAPDAAGLQFWDAAIAAGESRQQVALFFWNAPEHQAITVDQFYQSFLGRSADAAGLAYWTNLLTSGVSGSQVAVAFSTTPEFLAAHPTNDLYLLGVYLAVEGSAPAASNVLFAEIVTAFNAGLIDHAGVTGAVLGLPETYTNAIDDYFQSFLERSPDAAGRAFFTSEMLSGNFTPAVIGSQILGSNEYLELQNTLATGA
jgi:hypothetical protein